MSTYSEPFDVHVDIRVLEDPDLGDAQKIVWQAIKSVQGQYGETCRGGQAFIAKRCGKSRSSVGHAIRKLRRAGYLRRTDGGYRCCLPTEGGPKDVHDGTVYETREGEGSELSSQNCELSSQPESEVSSQPSELRSHGSELSSQISEESSQPTESQHPSEPTSQPSKTTTESSRAGERDPPCTPEQVQSRFEFRGLGPEDAEELTEKFFAHYEAQDWQYETRDGRTVRITERGPKSWKKRVENWIRRWKETKRHERDRNGKADSPGRGSRRGDGASTESEIEQYGAAIERPWEE